MLLNASGISDDFMEEILLLPAMLEIGIDGSGDPRSSCSRQFRAWTEYAMIPEILRIAYLSIGSDVAAFTLGHGESRQVGASEVPGNDEPFPFCEAPDTFTLWFPPKPMKAEKYAMVCVFDKNALFTRLIPAIARVSLKEQELYAYRIVNNRDKSVLFESERGIDPNAFDNPDCRIPLLRGGIPPLIRDREPVRLSPREGESGRKDSFFPYLEIQILNKQETLAEMTRHSTAQNAFFSFGIVAILAVAMGVLAKASSNAGQLATKQQEFIATVTHELKTPLAVIVSAAQNLSDGLVRDPGRIERYGDAIGKEATRLSVSIEHFLLYSNTGTQGQMSAVPCDIRDIIENALALTSQECADKGVTVQVSLPDAPIVVDGDPVALESVVRNLAENALRHAHDGKFLHILVEEEYGRASSRGYAVLKVQDHGPGISRKEQRVIFDPFVRGKRARSGQVPGSGIGLNLVRRIVTVHGGSVTVESKLGQGSTFIVKLPQGGGDIDGNQNSDDRG
jgi:signal transduction histidine kinase